MNPEKSVKISKKQENGEVAPVEVKMLYCAATETGYQKLSGKMIDVFVPTIEIGKDGKPYVKEPPKATDEDYIMLALAAIIAAYECNGEEAPIDSHDILYTATRDEVISLVAAVMQMRQEWVFVPSTIEKEIKETGDKPKNAKTPTKHSKRS